MYCSSCGIAVPPEISFCNRCGTSLKVRDENDSSVIKMLISAVVMVAIFGLGVMFFGAIALRKAGELNFDLVGIFMFFTFLTIATIEIFLMRQLSRELSERRRGKAGIEHHPLFQPSTIPPNEVRSTPLRVLPEPIPSVTENTTRTLETSFREANNS